MAWIKEHILELLGLVVAVLTYFKIGPEEAVEALSDFNFVLYIIAGMLIGWGASRAFYGGIGKRKRISRKEVREAEEQFQTDFCKCPYWIKVFLKTVLEKEEVFSKANEYSFETYSRFLLRFVDYKTVGPDEWQFSMSNETRNYFETNSQLLADVKEEDVRCHARKAEGLRYISIFSQDFNWWYYSDEDYMEPVASGPSSLFSSLG